MSNKHRSVAECFLIDTDVTIGPDIGVGFERDEWEDQHGYDTCPEFDVIDDHDDIAELIDRLDCEACDV